MFMASNPGPWQCPLWVPLRSFPGDAHLPEKALHTPGGKINELGTPAHSLRWQTRRGITMTPNPTRTDRSLTKFKPASTWPDLLSFTQAGLGLDKASQRQEREK